MMKPGTPLVRLALPSLLGLLAFSGALQAAAPTASTPSREKLKYGDNEVVVERTATATAGDVGLPFYPGAQLVQSYTYRVTATDGKQLSYYAMAFLATKDSPERVAKHYAAKLPGQPKPETLKDKEGSRTVLAVTSDTEVRSVTITKSKLGSDIRLTRATKHGEELKLPKPEIVPAPRMGPGGRGRMGPGGRGRMGPGGRGRMGPGRRGPSRRGTTEV